MAAVASSNWQPDRLLRIVLAWTALTFVPAWLPLIRGLFDGSSYEWGTSFFGYRVGGVGLRGDYWVVLLQSALGGTILWLGWRGARMPLHPLLIAWHALLFADGLYSSVTDPERYRFRGDTLGVDVSLAWVGPLLFGVFFVLALLWVLRDLTRRAPRAAPPWSPVNTAWVAALAALLPIQFLLLRLGPPHDTTDKIGVLVTIVQWLLLGVALRPRSIHATTETGPHK
jgi:hypothetical protein